MTTKQQILDKIYFEAEGKLTKEQAKEEQIKQGYYPQGYFGPNQVTYREALNVTTWWCYSSTGD